MGKVKRIRNTKIRDERRAEILSAAKRLFINYGYEKTTMKQVVKEAGTSIGNCYFYFPNKQALLDALIEELINDIRNYIDEIYSSFDSNITKIAATTYVLIKKLTQSQLYVNIFKGSHSTRLRVTRYFRTGLKRYLSNIPI